jgi:hypothetical protein
MVRPNANIQGRMISTMNDATMLGYMVKYTQQDLARVRGQRNWRTLFRNTNSNTNTPAR